MDYDLKGWMVCLEGLYLRVSDRYKLKSLG